MALGSWTGIYGRVIQELMEQGKDQELLLLLAIQKHCDPFGFAWPARITLMRLRHLSQLRYQRRLTFLEEHHYVLMTEGYDYQRRQAKFDFQVSPRVLYVRSEVQEYCELVFDGIQERDFATEKKFLEILFSTKESQPEAVPESEPESENQNQEPAKATRNNNQLRAAPRQQGRNASTMRNGAKPEQRDSAKQRRPAQPRKDNPQAGGADEFARLLSDDVDDDQIAKQIVHVVSTTDHQAKQAVDTYPRDAIVFWLEHTARRREKGELGKPGGYFFKMLQKHVAPIKTPGPNGQFDTSD